MAIFGFWMGFTLLGLEILESEFIHDIRDENSDKSFILWDLEKGNGRYLKPEIQQNLIMNLKTRNPHLAEECS